MIEVEADIGGEPSGHIILSNNDNFLVGDGLITLINIVCALDDQKSTLTDLKKIINKTPSRLINLKVADKLKFVNDTENIEILSPKNKLQLFGYDDYFNSFIKLFHKNKLQNTILLSGLKG